MKMVVKLLLYKSNSSNEVPTRTKGVTNGVLSQRRTRRNWTMREDAHYLQQDKKTPWSFTVTWHWVRAWFV